RRIGRAEQPYRQMVNLLDQRIVDLRDRDQLLELALELGVALPEHGDLPLDQRHGEAVRLVRQLQPEQQRSVALEEVRATLQIVRDRLLGDRLAERRLVFALTHSSIRPSYTSVVGPVCHSGWPGPGQRTVSRPPRSSTSTSSPSSPHLRPTADAAPAPVPQAGVSPPHRSPARGRPRPGRTVPRKATSTPRRN